MYNISYCFHCSNKKGKTHKLNVTSTVTSWL